MRAPGADEPDHRRQYRRDGFTWAAFGMLAGFGFLNALLGPALPYLRAAEHISYVAGSLHQVAFAVGGGLAGLAAARAPSQPGRGTVIRAGLIAAALAGLGIGYGREPAVTVTAAFAVSLLGTSALIRMWAALSDRHGDQRSVALIEGEAGVSLGGIIAPLLVGGLAASPLSWRFAFVAGAVIVAGTVGASLAARIPAAAPGTAAGAGNAPGHRDRPAVTLGQILTAGAAGQVIGPLAVAGIAQAAGLRTGLLIVPGAAVLAAGALLAQRRRRPLPGPSS
jgi:hypothetical protein